MKDYTNQNENAELPEEEMKKPHPARLFLWKYRKAGIAGAAVLVLALAFVLGVRPLLLKAEKQQYLGNAIQNVQRSLKGDENSISSRLLSIYGSCLRQGSLQAEAEAEIDGTPAGMKMEIASDREKNQHMFHVLLDYDSEKTDVDGYFDPDQVSVRSNALFGSNTYYGISFPDFPDKIGNSVFAADSGSKYALTEEEVKELTYGVGALGNVIGKNSAAWDKFFEQVKAAWKSVLTYKSPVLSKETVTIGDKEVKATVLTYPYDANDMKNTCSILADGILKNDVLGELLGEKAFSELKYEVRKAIDELNEIQSNEEINIVFYLNKHDKVMQVKLTDPKGSFQDIVLTLGTDNGKNGGNEWEVDIGGIQFHVKSGGDHNSNHYTDNTEIVIKAGLIEGTAAIDTEWDKEKGDLSVTITLLDEDTHMTIHLSGRLAIDGDKSFQLEFSKITAADGQNTMDIPLKLTARADTTSVISKPEMKNILDMKEEEIDVMGSRWQY